MPSRRIELGAADRQHAARDVAAALRRGELCALPTETVYGLAALPSLSSAVARLRALKGRAQAHTFTLHAHSAAAAAALATASDVRVQRLQARYWPGPLTLVLPARAGGDVGLRVPAHEFTRAVIAAAGEPLWLTSANRSGEAPLCTAPDIERAFGSELSFVVDDGPSPLGTASTVVRCTGPRLEVLREGILSAREVLHTAAAVVLFVCTGNTCRSPLAEVLAARAMAQALDVPVADLAARGIVFESAGTGTLDGMPASEGSLLAARETKLDLRDHRSQALTADLVRRADRIFGMSKSHLDAIVGEMPEAAAKTMLLRPDGRDIADPYGRETAAYRRARDEIEQAVRARLPEWRSLVP